MLGCSGLGLMAPSTLTDINTSMIDVLPVLTMSEVHSSAWLMLNGLDGPKHLRIRIHHLSRPAPLIHLMLQHQALIESPRIGQSGV